MLENNQRKEIAKIAAEVIASIGKKSRLPISSWVLGGSLAFVYKILTSPSEMRANYGAWVIKGALASFVVSAVLGMQVIMAAKLGLEIEENRELQILVAEQELPGTMPVMDESIENSKEYFKRVLGKKLDEMGPSLYDFIFQVFFFGLGAAALVVQFFIRF